MITLFIIFTLYHPYVVKKNLLIDSVYFYKSKVRLMLEKEVFDFPLEKDDSLYLLKTLMFKKLMQGKTKPEKYYDYVRKKDRIMDLLYLFKKGKYKKIYELLKKEEINKPEEYLIYLLASLRLKKVPEKFSPEKFSNSRYYPYILYLISIFYFMNKEYEKVIEYTKKIDYPLLKEDADFLLSLSNFFKYGRIKSIRDYIEKYKRSFYTDTLNLLIATHYYAQGEYRNARKYVERLVREKKFYEISLKMLIEIESLIGEDAVKFLDAYHNKFGENEEFKNLIKISILNLYSRKKFKDVIRIYERWGNFVKSKVFAAYIGALLKTKEQKKALQIISSEKDKFLKGIGYFKLGENYEANKKYWRAIKFYTISLKYLEEWSEFSQNIFLKKLLLEVKVGKIPNLKIAYKIFLKKFPGSEKKPRILKEMVEYLLKEGKLEEALVYQRDVFEIKKERDELIKFLDIAFNLKKFKIIDSIHKNVNGEFKDITGFYAGLYLYRIKRDPFSALDIFKKVLENEYESPYIRGIKYYVGEIYKSLGRLEESSNILKALVQGEDTIAFKSILLLSDIYKEREEIRSLEELLAKSSLRWDDEKKGHILFRLAEVKEIKGDYEDAKNLYLLSADFLFPSLDSLSLALFRAASLTELKEEKKALLERAKSLARNPFLKEEIEKSLIDLK